MLSLLEMDSLDETTISVGIVAVPVKPILVLTVLMSTTSMDDMLESEQIVIVSVEDALGLQKRVFSSSPCENPLYQVNYCFQ